MERILKIPCHEFVKSYCGTERGGKKKKVKEVFSLEEGMKGKKKGGKEKKKGKGLMVLHPESATTRKKKKKSRGRKRKEKSSENGTNIPYRRRKKGKRRGEKGQEKTLFPFPCVHITAKKEKKEKPRVTAQGSIIVRGKRGKKMFRTLSSHTFLTMFTGPIWGKGEVRGEGEIPIQVG